MNNDKSKSDENAEFLDDDFDLDDTENASGEFDDFDDAEWEEEFGDDASGDAPKKTRKSDVPPPLENLPRQKSFISKNFNLILILAVVLLGGGFFLFKMMGSPAVPPAETPADTAGNFTSGQDALPDTPAEGTDLSMEALPVAPVANIDDEFTTDDGSKLAAMEKDMAASIDEAPPMPAPIDSVPEDIEINKPEQPATKPAVPVQEVQEEALTPMDVEGTAAAGSQRLASLDQPLPVAAPAPVVDTAALRETNALVETQAKKIAALEEKIAKLEKEMASKVEGTDSKISDVSTTLAALDAKINALERTPVVSEAPKAVSRPAPVEEKIVTAPAPPAKPAIKSLIPEDARAAATASTPAVQTAAPRWELRFAQPGKAMLAEKGSSDFRTVEIGDTLSGLGKITSIGQESGKWVVRGTRGFVSQ